MSDAILLYGDLDLNDNVTYFLVKEGFKYPSPALKQAYADSALKDGQLPTEAWKFDNRVLSFSIFVRGTDAATLDAALRALYMQVYAQDATVTWCPAGRSTSFYFLAYRPEAVAADSYFNTTRRSVNEAIVTWSGQAFPFGHTARQSLESTVLSNSITKLTAGSPTDPPQITVTGLATGNAARIYDSTGSIYASAVESGGTATLTLELDVTDFGAVGDGTTDDTDAIQAAIDACPAGGTVYVPGGVSPDGVYMIRHDVHTVSAPGYDGHYHYGLEATAGMKLHLADDAILRMIPNSGVIGGVLGIVDIDGVEIYGGTIEGDDPNHTGDYSEHSHGIVAISVSNLHVHDITLQHCHGDGLYATTLQADGVGTLNTDITINNIIAQQNFRMGIGLACAVDATVSNSVFHDNTGEGLSSGVALESDAEQAITRVTISNNVFYDNQGHGIYIGGYGHCASYITFTGNESYGNGIHGFAVDTRDNEGQSSYITLDANNSHDNTQQGFRFKHADACLIENNQSNNNTSFGFSFWDLTDSVVSYNVSAGNTYNNSPANVYWDDACVGTTCDNNIGIPDR